MPESTSQQAAPAWRIFIDRARTVLWPEQVPDHPPSPSITPEHDRLRRLDRVRDLLEQTRADLLEHGWTSGGWFSVAASSGTVRSVSSREAYDLLAPGSPVTGLAGSGVDVLHAAIHVRLGHDSFPPGRSYSHEQRRAHLRTVTAWNDEPGRRLDDVLDVIDRAVARTIVAACRV